MLYNFLAPGSALLSLQLCVFCNLTIICSVDYKALSPLVCGAKAVASPHPRNSAHKSLGTVPL